MADSPVEAAEAAEAAPGKRRYRLIAGSTFKTCMLLREEKMRKASAKWISIAVSIIMMLALSACGSQKTAEPETQPDEPVAEEKAVEDDSEQQKEETSEVETVKVEEDADFGNMMLSEILTEIKRVQNGGDNYEILAGDLNDYLFTGPDGEERPLYYDLTDLNGDNYRELIIGGGEEGGKIYPLAVYMYMEKGDKLFEPELGYFYGIFSDGTIHTAQGNGVPDEEHKDGYYFRIDPSASGGITEVSPVSGKDKEFNWKAF